MALSCKSRPILRGTGQRPLLAPFRTFVLYPRVAELGRVLPIAVVQGRRKYAHCVRRHATTNGQPVLSPQRTRGDISACAQN